MFGPVYAGIVPSLHPRAAPKNVTNPWTNPGKASLFLFKKSVEPGGLTPLK